MEEPFDLPPDVLRRVPLFAELSKVLSWTGGPVNWDLARQVAVSIAAGERPSPRVDEHDHADAAEHVRIAELWITQTTGLPSPPQVLRARAGTRVDWAERAPDAYRELIDPVAAKATRALSDAGSGSAGLGGMDLGPIGAAVAHIAPMFMGIQTGTILGTVAQEVVGDTDVAFPSAGDDIVLVFETIDSFANDYQLDRRHARQYVALREVARRLLLDAWPGLRTYFFAQYHNYVASLDIDLARGIERLQQLDLSDPARLHEALGDEGLFTPEPSAESGAAAGAVADVLALLDAATIAAADAAAQPIGAGGPVAEAFRRRSIEDRRGAKLFSSFIGLTQGPDRRAGETFVRAVLADGGWTRLGRAWDDDASAPTAAELRDPDTWLRRTAG